MNIMSMMVGALFATAVIKTSMAEPMWSLLFGPAILFAIGVANYEWESRKQ
jgi:hypothetical protein